jgi:hypothetical protein
LNEAIQNHEADREDSSRSMFLFRLVSKEGHEKREKALPILFRLLRIFFSNRRSDRCKRAMMDREKLVITTFIHHWIG